MNAGAAIIVLIVLSIASLVGVSIVNRQQTKRRVISARIHSLRHRIVELEEVAFGIEPLLDDLESVRYVNEEILAITDTILRLDSNATYINPIKDAVTISNEKLVNGERNVPLNRALSSDAAIAKHQFYLKEASKIARKQHSQGTIDGATVERIIHELGWVHLMVEVISHIGQGHIATDQSNVIKASGYYKRAQQLLAGNNSSDPRRDQMIRELSEILTNKRQTISVSLMPETHLNPTHNPHAVPNTTDTADNTKRLDDSAQSA